MAKVVNPKKQNYNTSKQPLLSRVIGDGTAANSGKFEDWIDPSFGFNAELDEDPYNNVFAIIK